MSDSFDEKLHPGLNLQLAIDKTIYSQKTGLQDIIIFENNIFGRVMALDGVLQTTEKDEYIYHEMMAHIPILAHGHVNKVLIIGGGDGGVAREVLKYKDLQVTMIDIDRTVIDLCKQYMPSLSDGAFDDPRLDLRIADGCEFVKQTDRQWDVIIIDSTDPIGPGEALFTAEFYQDCKSCLARGGIMVTQNGVPFVQTSEFVDGYRKLNPLFADAGFYMATIPSYVGGPMAFGWATDNEAHRKSSLAQLAQRFLQADITTKYYTPQVHQAAFVLPMDVQMMLKED